MLAFAIEMDTLLTPGLDIVDEFKLLIEPGVKRVSDPEASAQTVCFRCS
jgi:hypothetical protein